MGFDYLRLTTVEFFETYTTEESARDLFWVTKFEGKDFVCRGCGSERYSQHHARAEIRQCLVCDRQNRVRAGTMFQNSKVPLLTWLRAIYLVAASKRGMSATELQRQLRIKTYKTAWRILRRIRDAMGQRDDMYELHGVVEVDGAHFESMVSKGEHGEAKALIAIESKDWVDDKGRPKSRAGFAKVIKARETSIRVKEFVDDAVSVGSEIHADGSPAYGKIDGRIVEQEKMLGSPEALERWLPWVHRFISNAKAWIIGTHHGISAKYFAPYLSEYTYRFNRRHDLDGLWHRVLRASCLAQYRTLDALCA